MKPTSAVKVTVLSLTDISYVPHAHVFMEVRYKYSIEAIKVCRFRAQNVH